MLSTLADLGRETGDLLRSAELIRTVNNPEYAGANQKTEEIYCSVVAQIAGSRHAVG